MILLPCCFSRQLFTCILFRSIFDYCLLNMVSLFPIRFFLTMCMVFHVEMKQWIILSNENYDYVHGTHKSWFLCFVRVSLARYSNHIKKRFLNHSLVINLFDWPSYLNDSFVFNIKNLFPYPAHFKLQVLQLFVLATSLPC